MRAFNAHLTVTVVKSYLAPWLGVKLVNNGVRRTGERQINREVSLVSVTMTVGIIRRVFAESIAGRVVRIFSFGLVMDLRRRAHVTLPISGPVEILRIDVVRMLRISEHVHAIDQTSYECHESEDEKDYTQYPEISQKKINK